MLNLIYSIISMGEYTFSMLKPNVISEKLAGKIIQYFERENLIIAASKMIHLTKNQAQFFLPRAQRKRLFDDLVKYITSGPVIAQVLFGKNAISLNRKIMGSTDPKDADKGTIRGDLAKSIDANLVHGSDSPKSAQREIQIFFQESEIFKIN